MSKILKDPFGGVKGVSKVNSPSPFKIDKEESLKELKTSVELWKKNKKIKKSFLQKLRIKKDNNFEIKALHWAFSDHSKKYVDIHLVWAKSKIRTLSNVPIKKVITALNGLKEFYKKISTIRPDLNNPDILLCYNQTAKNYKLPQKKLKFKDQIEVTLLDPFAGVKGENLDLKLNDFTKDKFLAIEQIQFSIDFFNQIDKMTDEKKEKFLKKKIFKFFL